MYFMRYVEGIPRSEQILWFIDNYVEEKWKAAERYHVERYKHAIDTTDDRGEIGVFSWAAGYNYLFWYESVKGRTEVFYRADNITLGELI